MGKKKVMREKQLLCAKKTSKACHCVLHASVLRVSHRTSITLDTKTFRNSPDSFSPCWLSPPRLILALSPFRVAPEPLHLASQPVHHQKGDPKPHAESGSL